jgi:hypothetical protein
MVFGNLGQGLLVTRIRAQNEQGAGRGYRNVGPFVRQLYPKRRDQARGCLEGLWQALEHMGDQAQDRLGVKRAGKTKPVVDQGMGSIPSTDAGQGLGRQRTWGFLLAARYPEATPIPALISTLDRSPARDQLAPLVRALEKVRDPNLAPALTGFYLRLPEEQRPQLHPLLKLYRQSVLRQLEHLEIEAPSQVTLRALLGAPPEDTRRDLEKLDDEQRVHALTELVDEEELLRPLPWAAWLEKSSEMFAEVAAAFASRAGLRELLPIFRRLVTDHPAPFLVRVLGDLGDRESVGRLVTHLEPPGNPLEPIVLESLGRIGGPEARKILARIAVGADESTSETAGPAAQSLRARLAFRALARCAAEEDDRLFRTAIGHTDWYIRLSCAEVLGRFSRPENLAALAQLASDPVPIVAQRALAFLES